MQKLDKVSKPLKVRSSLKIQHRVNLYSSRYMHDSSFVALALIVSAKMI